MVDSPSIFHELRCLIRRVGKDLLSLAHVRVELLTVELQEERERLITAFLLAVITAALGLLAGFTFTLAVAVLLWEHSPGYALLILTATYSLAALFYYKRLTKLRHEWAILPETLHQLQKDRECLDQWLD